MKNEKLILDRLDRLEEQISPLVESARSIGELRDELAPRVNEAVQALIGQLEEVESDFQLEDLLFLIKKAMRNVNNLSYSLDQLKNIIDFVDTAEPLFKSTVPRMILFLDELERIGVFNIFNICMDILKKISETYTAEDMEQFGNGLVLLLGAAKKLTTPESLELLDKAAEIPASVDVSRAKDVGLFGMMGAMGDSDVKAGLGVLMELTKGLATLKIQRQEA